MRQCACSGDTDQNIEEPQLVSWIFCFLYRLMMVGQLSSQMIEPVEFSLSRYDVNIRLGHAAECQLFAWVRVEVNGSLKISEVRAREWHCVSEGSACYPQQDLMKGQTLFHISAGLP